MRIALVEPPRPDLAHPGAVAPLGLGYIAAMVRQERPDLECNVLNLSACSVEDAADQLIGYDVCGFTCSTLDYPIACRLAEAVRLLNRGADLVVGGPHITALACTPETFEDAPFEMFFAGEGEFGFLDYLKYGDSWQRSIYCSQRIRDLDALPFPVRDTANPGGALITGGAISSAAIMASRGCPYNCAFCCNDAVYPEGIVFRSPGNVVAEIRHVMDTCGVTNIWFADDSIATRQSWTEQLCQKIAGLGVKWRGSIRAIEADKALLKKLRKAGCAELAIGIESFDDDVLEAVRKPANLKANMQAIMQIHNAGIKVRALLVIGTPGETTRTVDRNLDALEVLDGDMDVVVVSTLMPMPGSPIWKDPQSFGIIIESTDFSQYNIRMWQPDMKTVREPWSPIHISGLPRSVQLDNIRRMREYARDFKERHG